MEREGETPDTYRLSLFVAPLYVAPSPTPSNATPEAITFLSISGRTELIISASRAKNCEEFAVKVRFSVDPPKPGQKGVKRFPRPKNLADFFLFFAKN